MALSAGNTEMQPRERVARKGMVKTFYVNLLPVREPMALQAVITKPPVVLVSMTADARRRKTKKSFATVGHTNRHRLGSGHMVGRVTSSARESGVMSFQFVPGCVMVEMCYIPLNQDRSAAVMFGMTVEALVTGPGCDVISRVQPPMGGDPIRYLFVTGQTSKSPRTGREFVATSAVSEPRKRLMRPRELAWRNLTSRLG